MGLPEYYRANKGVFSFTMGLVLIIAVFSLIHSVRISRGIPAALRLLVIVVESTGSLALLLGGVVFNRAGEIAELKPEILNRRFFLEIIFAAAVSFALYALAMLRDDKRKEKLEKAGLWTREETEEYNDRDQAHSKALLRSAGVVLLSLIGIFAGTSIVHFGPALFGRTLGEWVFNAYAGWSISCIVLTVSAIVELPLMMLFGNPVRHFIDAADPVVDEAAEKVVNNALDAWDKAAEAVGRARKKKKDGSLRKRMRKTAGTAVLVLLGLGLLILAVLSPSLLGKIREKRESSQGIRITEISVNYHSLSLNELKRMAEDGDPEAQFQLGNRIYYGTDGAEEDKQEALRWYRMAAEQGHDRAQREMGFCYESGNGVEKDYEEALRWYHLAADQDNSSAMRDIGMMTEWGYGTEPDVEAGREWYLKAAESGYIHAYEDLAYSYLHQPGNRDAARAAMYLEKGAEAGDSFCKTDLAELYMEGDGVEQNDEKAFGLLEEVTGAGYSPAKAYFLLGELYEEGRGTEKDLEKAIWAYTQAKELNYQPAVTALSRLGQ